MTSDFTYYTPTKVVFGKNTESQVGTLIKEFKGKKVLIHYGSASAKRSGLLDKIITSLIQSGLDYVTLGGVVPNPRLSLVHEGIALCKQEGVDFLLAVGGGSVIDSCKAIGYGLYNEGEVWDFYDRKRVVNGCYPIGAILTLAAAGSEMSSSSVITNEEGDLKRGLNSDTSRCRFAIMNPELTYTLPPYQTMCGAVDIMMHTMERYFTAKGNMFITDGLAEALLKTVIYYAPKLKNKPDDYEGRANLMWASSLSHNGLTSAGNSSPGDWAPHQLEHEIGGMFDVAHGAGLSAIWNSWATYVYANNPSRFANFGEKVFDLPRTKNVEADALAAIEATKDFFASLDMPINLNQLGIHPTEAQIVEMAEKCTFFGKRTLGDFKTLGKEDLIAIYKNAEK
ncbi:iron-containing alcohol dehydrogenase [uncultured Sphaerochaeta sp.]|uniref:iron-containing alcohol dehydrogenase n=1 Tax=uncultured Sphaerochaeta sp. TaxID=886478 RepID=UPI002A0A9B2F|nr:iron-containing alcohol dehydrogenase [uncultured Sphaerochaeta sp.]